MLRHNLCALLLLALGVHLQGALISKKSKDLHVLSHSPVRAGSSVDFSKENSTPCMLNEHGQEAWPCHIEYNSRAFVRKWLPSNASVLEIGARYGSVSCVIAGMQHQSGKVVAVEADPTVWDALDKNLKRYACNVNVLKGVVGTTPVVSQVLGNGGYGSRTVPASIDASPTQQVVPAYPLAQVEETFKMHFDTLIVDCEGCLTTLLRENPELVVQVNMIIAEAHSDLPGDTEEQSVAKLESKFGFKVVDQLSRQRVLIRVQEGTAGSSGTHQQHAAKNNFTAAQEVFLQRSAVHFRHYEPQNVENMEMVLGIPKIVWVILADVVAITVFLTCIPIMMHVSKTADDGEEEDTTGFCAGLCCDCCCNDADDEQEDQQPLKKLTL